MKETLQYHYINGHQGNSFAIYQSKDDFEVHLIKIIMGVTYKESGLIWGHPDENVNNIAIENISKQLLDYPNHIYIEEDRFIQIEGRERMKMFYFAMMFESHTFKTNQMFSSLSYVGFREEFNLDEILNSVEKNIFHI